MPARYVSKTNDIQLSSLTEAHFLSAALRHYLAVYAARAAHRRLAWRTPSAVRRIYDRQRAAQLERAAQLSWDEMLYGGDDERDAALIDDRITWATPRAARALNLTRIQDAVRSYVRPGGTVIELGCGSGRNLLYVKRMFPDVRCVGLELSPVSVALARALAERFHLDVEFHECDVTGQLPPGIAPGSAALAFTVHALEQIPRLHVGVVQRMSELASGGILLLEPVPELWPRNARGMVSRLRVRALDRLLSLTPALHALQDTGTWSLTAAHRLRTAANPLNETCELRMSRVPRGAKDERGVPGALERAALRRISHNGSTPPHVSARIRDLRAILALLEEGA
ncbi:MAG TPA: class I SAM-dependent methyltransferase [Gemmatimonadaceae bacterium]